MERHQLGNRLYTQTQQPLFGELRLSELEFQGLEPRHFQVVEADSEMYRPYTLMIPQTVIINTLLPAN